MTGINFTRTSSLKTISYNRCGNVVNRCRELPFHTLWAASLLDEFSKLNLYWSKFEGTAANARDVASVVDAIDGIGSEINFWSVCIISFLGTFL